MNTRFILLLLLCFTLGMTSCSPDDYLTETPTFAGGDEIDDPVEPDREDD